MLISDKNGDVLSNIKNKKAEYKNYSYYYSSPADILNSMKDVLKYFDIDIPEVKKGDSLKPKKSPTKITDDDQPKGPETKNKAKPSKEEENKPRKSTESVEDLKKVKESDKKESKSTETNKKKTEKAKESEKKSSKKSDKKSELWFFW